MREQNVRVVLASEYPETRSFLSQIIEQQSGVEIVGQAYDAARALTLTKNLRPDVVILDCYLPYCTSLDAIPLSRVSGLDTAQAITEEVPRTKVMLLNNLDNGILPDGGPRLGPAVGYCVGRAGKCISIVQWAQSLTVANSNELLFANVTLQEPEAFQEKAASLSDKLVFFGALGFAAGWLLTITMIMAPVGIPLAVLGGLTAIAGLAGNLIASLWRKMSNRKRFFSTNLVKRQ